MCVCLHKRLTTIVLAGLPVQIYTDLSTLVVDAESGPPLGVKHPSPIAQSPLEECWKIDVHVPISLQNDRAVPKLLN